MEEEKNINIEEKLDKTEDVLVVIKSYIKIARCYVEANVNNPEVLNLGMIMENIYDKIEELNPYYDILGSV